MTSYEECSKPKDEIIKMTDEQLSREYYDICLEYCRGIGLM